MVLPMVMTSKIVVYGGREKRWKVITATSTEACCWRSRRSLWCGGEANDAKRDDGGGLWELLLEEIEGTASDYEERDHWLIVGERVC